MHYLTSSSVLWLAPHICLHVSSPGSLPSACFPSETDFCVCMLTTRELWSHFQMLVTKHCLDSSAVFTTGWYVSLLWLILVNVCSFSMAFKVQWAVGDLEQLHVSFFIKMFKIFKKMMNRVNPCAQKPFRKMLPVQPKPAVHHPEITTILTATF